MSWWNLAVQSPEAGIIDAPKSQNEGAGANGRPVVPVHGRDDNDLAYRILTPLTAT